MNIDKILSKDFRVGVIGLGYVGLPLALEFVERGIPVIGFELLEEKCTRLMAGKSYIRHISTERTASAASTGLLEATTDFSRLCEVDVVLIAVPTPLDKHLAPDLGAVCQSARDMGKALRKGQLVVLESTTYPGTVEEVLVPILEEESGLKVNQDFLVAFSPEREDPNNPSYNTHTIPKVVGGLTEETTKIACAVYDHVIVKTVPVSTPRAAEATKLLENIYRSVNIAMINELKIVFDRMGIDIWEVVEAAKTKPFGFHAFYPGPGLGGHCIPIDPFYLSWKAKEYGMHTRFIELAGEINTSMPEYVLHKMLLAFNDRQKAINGSRVLLVGMAYKKNIDDMRESPSIELIRLLVDHGAEVVYHDPFIPVYQDTLRKDISMTSVDLSDEVLHNVDAVLISTDHDGVDYDRIVQLTPLVIDTRNATGSVKVGREKIYKS
jgi:UDP-N-acetyl-D-glucosamine dehydrogenase